MTLCDYAGAMRLCRGYAFCLDNVLADMNAAHTDLLFNQIDRNPQKYQPVAAAVIPAKQEASRVADQPPGFVDSGADRHHDA